MAEEVLLSTNVDEMSVSMAKEQELESWKQNNVFTEVPNENQPHVTCRWVITSKEVNEEAKTQGICKLNKAVYGLNEASRYWYERVKDVLINAGMLKSKYDEALFYWKMNGKVQGIIAIHVDDFLYAGSDLFAEIMKQIRKAFAIGSEASTPIKYLGINLDKVDGEIMFSQQSYIESVDEVDLRTHKDEKERDLNPEEQSAYHAICGQLNWICCTQSRPDISYDVCQLSAKLNDAKVNDVLLANKVVKKVKRENICLKFKRLTGPMRLIAYSDASYANLKDGSPQGGIIIFLADENGNVSPLYWSSPKLRRVCRSTLAAETSAALDATDLCIWLTHIINEIDHQSLLTTLVRTDNKSLSEVVYSTKAVEEKRLRVEIAALRESVERKEIKVEWIRTRDQTADVFTKQGADNRLLLDVLRNGLIGD